MLQPSFREILFSALCLAAFGAIPAPAQDGDLPDPSTLPPLPVFHSRHGDFKLGKRPYPAGTRAAWIGEGRVLAAAPEGTFPRGLTLKGAADNKSYLPAIGDQGSEGSCVHWAGTYHVKTATMKRLLPSLNITLSSNKCSPRFTYNLTNAGEDNGGWGHEPFEIFMRYGVASLAQLPYTAGDYTVLPDTADFLEGLHRRSTNYVWVWDWNPGTSEINELKAWLDAGGVAACGVYAESTFDAWNSGDSPWVGSTCTYDDINHMVTVCGYGSGWYLIANSWGTSFGSNGFIYVDSDYFENYFSDVMYPLEGVYAPSSNYLAYTVRHTQRSDIRELLITVNGANVWSNYPLPKDLPKDTGNFVTDDRNNLEVAIDLSFVSGLAGSIVTARCLDAEAGLNGTVTVFSVVYNGAEYVSTSTPVYVTTGTYASARVAVAAGGTPPSVATLAISNDTPTSAMSGGNVTADGGATVTQRGVCWSASSSPTTNDSKTSNGSGTGSFSSSLTGLTPGQAYYVRAYAVNSNGVGYGSDVGFSADCFTNAPGGLTTGSVDETSFTASWNAVGGATGYRLDVGTNAAFAGGGAGTGGVEGFSGIGGGTTSSYLTRIWTNNGVAWTAYKARTDQSIDGSSAICLQNAADAWFTSGTLTGGVDQVSIVCTQVYSGSGGTFDIFVNSTKVASAVPITTSITTTRVTGIGVTGDFTIMVTNSGLVRVVFDNLTWTNAGGGGSAYVPGYQNRSVAGTSQSVTGLTGGLTYYVRVRAEGAGGCVSGNSSTQSVTTSGGGLPEYYTDWADDQGFDPYGANGGPDDDYDGDGTPNMDELTAGTDATDDTSEFEVVAPESMSPTQYSLTVDAITGRIYSLYYKTNAVDGVPWSLFKAWTNLSAGEQDLILTNSALFQLYRLGVRSP